MGHSEDKNEDAIKHGISFVLPLNAPKIKFHYWWTLFIDGYVRLNPLQKLVRKEQSEKINPRTNLMEYADMKSSLNPSQVWFNQQSFSLYYQTFYMFY